MHKLILVMTLIFTSIAHAGQFEIIDGDAAFKVFNELKGKKCIEYQTNYQIVFSRTNSLNCFEETSASEWQCTVQYEKNQKTLILQSSSCVREVD